MSTRARRQATKAALRAEKARLKEWVAVLLSNAGFGFGSEGELDAIVREYYRDRFWRTMAKTVSPNNPSLIALVASAP